MWFESLFRLYRESKMNGFIVILNSFAAGSVFITLVDCVLKKRYEDCMLHIALMAMNLWFAIHYLSKLVN